MTIASFEGIFKDPSKLQALRDMDFSLRRVDRGSYRISDSVVYDAISNAQYAVNLNQWRRLSISSPSWTIETSATTDSIRLLRAPAGTNPIIWSELVKFTPTALVLGNGATTIDYDGDWHTTFPTPPTTTAYTQTVVALGANARAGDLYRSYVAATQDDSTSLVVPTGRTLKIIQAQIRAVTGAAAGTYTVRAQLKNITGPVYTTLATATGAQNATIRATAFGTRAAPLASFAASTEFNLVIYNDTSSPGALANVNHLAVIVYVLDTE